MPIALDSVLAPNALVSLDEVKAHLSITRPTVPADLSDEDVRLVDAINWVSAFVESYVRPMSRKTATLRLELPRHPHLLRVARVPILVTDPVELTFADGAPLTVWRSEDDGVRADADVLVYSSAPDSPWCPDAFYRRAGWGLGSCGHWLGCSCGGYTTGSGGDPQPIRLTYTGGFDCLPATGPNQLPGDMHNAVLEAIRAWTRDQQQGTADLTQITQPGGGPTFSVPRWMPYRSDFIFRRHWPVYAAP